MQQQVPSPPSVAAWDSPKGLSKFFILLCPSIVPLDALISIFSLISPILVRLSLIIIPSVLALSRLLYSSSPVTSILATSASFVILFLAEQVHHSILVRKKGSVRISSVTSRDGAGLKYFREIPSTPDEAAAAAAAAIKTSAPAAATAPTAKDAPVAAATTGKAPATSSHAAKAVDPAAQARSSVIALESLLYGNELTEDLLPPEVLPTRVQRICDEVGVRFNGASMQDLVRTLNELKKAVGI